MASDPSSPADNVDGSGPPGSPNALRRARKRATDRKSQRNHRERQRAYVRNLEKTVAAVNSANNSDERVAALLAENEAFRKRCDSLVSQLRRIRNIASEAETEAQPTPPSPSPLSFDAMEDDFDFLNDDTPAPPPDRPTELIQTSADAQLETGLCPPIFPEGVAMNSCFTMSDAIPMFPNEPDLDFAALIPMDHASLLDGAMSLTCSPSLPPYSPPQGAADRLVQAMLEEARAEHQAGKFDASEPSLKRLLAGGPADILSFRLFHYIKSYGPMPMHWMLATFWVQYLYLRVSWYYQ